VGECLARLLSEEGGVTREDLEATYEAATGLLADIWAVVREDVRTGAAQWAGRAVARAVARRAGAAASPA
jgi:hypothetical protein